VDETRKSKDAFLGGGRGKLRYFLRGREKKVQGKSQVLGGYSLYTLHLRPEVIIVREKVQPVGKDAKGRNS